MKQIDLYQEFTPLRDHRGRWVVTRAIALTLWAGVFTSAAAIGPRAGAMREDSLDAAPGAAPQAESTSRTPPQAAAAAQPPTPPAAPETLFLHALDGDRLAPLAPLRAATWRLQGWMGIGLSCDDCSVRDDAASRLPVWEFEKPPTVRYVDPDGPAGKAGLQRGDVLVKIDGLPLTSREGGKKFGAVQPGDTVQWTYERDGQSHVVTLVAAEHPDRPGLDPGVAAQIEASLAKLRNEQARLAEEAHTLRADKLAERSLQDALRQVESARRTLEFTQRSLGQQRGLPPEAWAPEAPARAALPAAHKLRYEGTIGTSHVEVRGSGAVVVTEDAQDEIVITTPDATIRIRKQK